MSNYENLITALNIFRKYTKGDHEWLTAEHDEIWAGPDPEVVSAEDIAALEKLGWNVSDTGNFHSFV